ncbi:MAG: glycosyltransferase family 4 protein [Bacteroidota bacterium]|nr:glycosyltransferase family 4 protein [Bacteroidota bacterium]
MKQPLSKIPKLVFLYLTGFSFTGGIEKFNRSFLKALHELSVDGIIDADAISSYDVHTDEKYFPRLRFKGFGGKRFWFVTVSILRSLRYQMVVLGHINLAVVGYVLKRIKPQHKLIIIVHGIEVWREQGYFKKRALQEADSILSVSHFTKQQLLKYNPFLKEEKIRVFPNTIDSYFGLPASFSKPAYLLERYHIDPTKKILVTVTRMAFSEKYKGYDVVLEVMSKLKEKRQDIVYLICGKAEPQEKARVEELIRSYGLEDNVQMTGYVADHELNDHYLLSDVFVMPSKKEGFGIVFIEALACGRRVIAGNKDGSVDALLNGELGILIDPDHTEELQQAIEQTLALPVADGMQLQQQVLSHFGFQRYKQRLKEVLQEIQQ